MKILPIIAALLVLSLLTSCTTSHGDITSSATGEVITTMTARATGGASPFDGRVDSTSDLEDLVEAAWGTGRFGLQRGHRPIQRVLEACLGISHDEMHVLMEDKGLNLAAVCDYLGFDADNLVETLTASFVPYIQQGVTNGVITEGEVATWTERVRTQFRKRVYWKG